MSQQYVFTLQGIRKVVPPNREILREIWLSFLPGAKIGVVGLNGSGKSSLLKIMAGLDEEYEGKAYAADGVSVGFLPQEPVLDPSKDVLGNVKEGLGETVKMLDEFNELSTKMCEPMEPDAMEKVMAQMAVVQDKIDACNGWEIERQLDIAMDALRCPPGDSAVETLSGGEVRRVALCRLLLEKPDMLLLDEPTNHLDAASVSWLERHLREYEGTVVIVTHDRYFLDNVTGWVLELDRGYGVPWEGNYSSWLQQKQEKMLLEQKQDAARSKTIERELEWINTAPKARHKKSKARISQYEDMVTKDRLMQQSKSQIILPAGPRLGDVVVKAENVKKQYGDKLLFENFSFDLPKGGIVGVVGPNGAGKTTLMKLITGAEQTDSGNLQIGSTVDMAYVDQFRDDLSDDRTVWEEISGGAEELDLGGRKVKSRAYCSGFNFRGADQ
ncbi:MAG: energy-dependent translational throttle protein EttA, partial [bacterium]|nr:energy-dependent translational throttle protein EttA [bacterium]